MGAGATATIDIDKEGQQLAVDTKEMAARYSDFPIVDGKDCERGAEVLKEVKAYKNKLEEKRFEMTRPLDQAKKSIMEFFRQPMDALDTLERNIKSRIISYQQEERRKADIAQKKLQAAADAKAKELRDKAAAEAAKGNTAKAAQLMDKAAEKEVAVPVVAADIPKVAGVFTKQVWKYQIIDVNAIPREYMIPDEKKIGAMARASKGTLQIPGVKIYPEDSLSAGQGRGDGKDEIPL
jgi:hypothetical protein